MGLHEVKPSEEFRVIHIHPSHSARTAILTWSTSPELEDADFYVYRKYDGGGTWELLDGCPVTSGEHTLVDTGFTIPNKVQVPMYRILAVKDGKEYVSPDVALLSKSSRVDYGIAQNIIRTKYLQARHDGTPVLYYPLIRNGKISGSLDSVTGQRVVASCPGTSGDDGDHGEYYEGGFYRPFVTFVRFLGARLEKENILDVGKFDSTIQDAQFLAFPPVRTGDMIVDVATDNRWFVDSSINPELVRSSIPVGYTARVSLQPHNSPCYGVPLPTNYKEMLHHLTWPMF